MVKHYTYKLVNDKVWQIDVMFRNRMYLIEGSKKALLIDTGMGLEGLKEVISEIAEKELLVINTHGHIDHTLGNSFLKLDI
ncbi:MAG: MBL fold metallo-hydrolase [Terrisporobacter sp.]|uniref:MBL fold metallo-hydrolase n=1 Tax=Terrisporobacter sp. TaxID=1965305 RepID=UPI002FC90962